MHTLKSLTLTAVPKQQLNNPVLTRRAKLIARLQEQKALLVDPTFTAVHQTWETMADGRKERVERKRKVRRWWREDAMGAVYLVLRYGQKPIEIEKGKAAVTVPTKEGLDEVLNILITAVNHGELDDALATMSKQRLPRNKSTA
jgi:hypothetical protein